MKNQQKAEGIDMDRPKMAHSELVAKIKQYLTTLDAAIINEERESIQKAIIDLRVSFHCCLHG